MGAGAVADWLRGQDPAVEFSADAEAATLAFRALRPLTECPSGRELVDKGFAEDVRIAGQVQASTAVPVLIDGCFESA